MLRDVNQLDRFLQRVHRRWTILRALERIALCTLIASVVAVILSTILIARGESAMSLVMICIAIGAICGLIVGWMTRPTLFDTATEVDRQLSLADLLATAVAVRRSQTVVADSIDDQWSQTILSIAEARCGSLVNEPLMLRRLGVRAWGGVGVCLTIAFALGAMSMNPLVLQAKNGTGESEQAREQTSDLAISASERVTQVPTEQAPESSAASTIEATAKKSDASSAAAGAESGAAAGSSGDQQGPGAGRTNDPDRTTRPLIDQSGGASSSSGELSSGGGQSATNATSGATSSTSTDATAKRSAAPPWTSTDWRESHRRADEQIRAKQIPDAYRDLVRDYFER